MCHLGGGYGRNGNGPQAEQAIYIANLNRGTPIHLLWTREEDFINTTYRSIGVAKLRAVLDRDGWPIAVEVKTATDEQAPGTTAGFDIAARYFAPNYRFSIHSGRFHIPVGTRRGVGAPAQHFYRESFMDELARAVGKDPYLYRRELISRTSLPYKADMIEALDIAAEMSGWGKKPPAGRARGFAFAEYALFAPKVGSLCGAVAEISLDRKTGRIRVHNYWAAADAGLAINPTALANQVESAIVWGLSTALKERVTMVNGQVQQSNFHQYELMRMSEVPEIKVEVITGAAPIPSMVGELGVPCTAPAVANAFFALTGKRLYHMPFTPERVRAALKA